MPATTPDSPLAPTIEIALDNVEHNCAALQRRSGANTGIMAVVKDNAYGCGSVPVAQRLQRQGIVSWFVVARTAEALLLRAAGIRGPLLVLGECTGNELRAGTHHGLSFCINSLRSLHAIDGSAIPARVHLNVDTGMGRLGLSPAEIAQSADLLNRAPHLVCEGVFTHLACADAPDATSARAQIDTLGQAVAQLRSAGISPPCIHAENSAALTNLPRTPFLTHVRPGILLYGCSPDPATPLPHDIRGVASLGGPVVRVTPVAPNTPVSYGWRYRTRTSTRIATVALGYAHGVPRSLGNGGEMLLKGKRYPLAGTVTMDYCMLDIGLHNPVEPGERACIFGWQGEAHLSLNEAARRADTIGYELLCRMSRSIDRVYTVNGQECERVHGTPF